MTRVAFAVLAIGSAMGCSPAPRSASYFASHQVEAARVSAACAKGSLRGEECTNALAGVAAAEDAARLQLYRRAF